MYANIRHLIAVPLWDDNFLILSSKCTTRHLPETVSTTFVEIGQVVEAKQCLKEIELETCPSFETLLILVP